MEVLATGAKAVCLPYAGGLESEQTIRCRLLAERGAMQIVEKADVSAANVAAAVDRAFNAPSMDQSSRIDTMGATNSARILDETLSRQ